MKRLLKNYDVIVLGAGAAGLMCAATAARRGRRVLVLEKANKVGKKILMSGGGRCNFTNYTIASENYISQNSHFCKAALSRYTQWDFIAMIERYGIAYEERKHGQLFCRDSAKDILAMLLSECEQTGVDIRSDCDVMTVDYLSKNGALESAGPGRDGELYQVTYYQGTGGGRRGVSLDCKSLVVATGALSIPTLGGSGFGYDIARQFGLPLVACRAGLVPFMFSDFMKTLCEKLSGLAVEVEVRCKDQAFTENLLFTHRGLSGPAILQISNYWSPGEAISVDLLPGVNAVEWLVNAKQTQGKKRLASLLSSKLAKALVMEIQGLWWPEHGDKPLAEFNNKLLVHVGEQLNDWRLKPSATEGYRTAEVTLGGVDTGSISSKTMAVKQQAGLYFVGEVLDISGHLGGFNFQWAWSSGYSAGLHV